MLLFDSAFEYVIEKECGNDRDKVTCHHNDKGGMTKYGISFRFLNSIADPKKYGFFGEIWLEDDLILLTIQQAKAIYKGEFWDHAPFEKINVEAVRNYIFDIAVNSGIAPAIKCAQRACWAVQGSRHILVDDGILGNDTLSYINKCGTDILYALRSERAGYYRLIVEKNESQKDFIEGWLNRAYA